ncbi:MAG: SurA N-terminal domain-containing protein [Moraxellaceae bacterium]|nr:SurA N-terminal domain-containing protein [Moraxellaceae bacterium]
MQAFRDMLRGWVGKALLVLLTVPFALVGIESYFVGGKAAPVATVNDEDISQFELDRSVDQQKQRLLASMGDNADASRIDTEVLRNQVLKSLIDRALLTSHAHEKGFLIDDESIIRLIHETPAFQENGAFSQARYEQVLRNSGEDPVNFPAKAKKEIAVSQMTGGIIQTAFVTPKQVDALSVLDSQKRDIHIAVVPAASYLAKVQVSDEEVATHYKANTAKYTTEEKVAVDYLVLGAELFTDKVLLTDADVEARYAERLKNLTENEQRRAAHILIKITDKVKDADALATIKDIEKRVQAGEDFGALAKQYSQDEGSAINNGDLGFVGKGAFVPEFEKTMYALQPNQVSAPVKTQFGYHIIKLLEVQKAAAPNMADIRSELEAEVRAIKSEELYAEAIEKMDALAYESSDLSEAAKQYNLTVQVSPLFAKNGGTEGLAGNKKIVQAAFSDDVLKDGKNSSALALDNKHSVWIHLNKHEASRVKPLAEVAADIKLTLQLDKAGALAKQTAEAMSKALNEGKNALELAASNGVAWQDFPASTRTSAAPLPEMLKVAFRLPNPKASQWTAAVNPSGKDYAIVAISRIDAGVASYSDEQKKQFSGMLANVKGQQELQDYLSYLRANAKIKQATAKEKAE